MRNKYSPQGAHYPFWVTCVGRKRQFSRSRYEGHWHFFWKEGTTIIWAIHQAKKCCIPGTGLRLSIVKGWWTCKMISWLLVRLGGCTAFSSFKWEVKQIFNGTWIERWGICPFTIFSNFFSCETFMWLEQKSSCDIQACGWLKTGTDLILCDIMITLNSGPGYGVQEHLVPRPSYCNSFASDFSYRQGWPLIFQHRAWPRTDGI